MKLFFRIVLVFLFSANFINAQSSGGSGSKKNAPSEDGYIQQSVTENNPNLQLMGADPVQVKDVKTQTTPAPAVPQQSNSNTGQQTTTKGAKPLPQDSSKPYIDTTKLPSSLIFGHDYFRNTNFQMFNRTTDAAAMGNYIVGIGDQIGINVWGYSSFSGSYTVDQTGSIMPEGVGKIYVKGLTLDKSKQLIRSRFATYLDMPNSQIEVTIIYSRVIAVNIVGEVYRPGTYSIPALNTAFNALLAANGPTDLGSVRQIFIKRQGKTIQTLDVYKFLLDPNSSTDFFLENNDYIFVPAVEKIVSIGGEVNRPSKYELIDGEDISTLLTYAGGLTAKAYTRAVQVKRFSNGQFILMDLNLDSLKQVKGKFNLMNGDEVLVGTVPTDIFKFVKVSGAVMQEGQYAYTNGMKISDVLSKAHGLKVSAMTDRAYIIRKKSDLTSNYITFNPSAITGNPASAENLTLENLDEIYFFDKKSFVDTLNVTVSGGVRLPGKFDYAEGMTLNDVLYTSGGLKPEAANTSVVISRYQNGNSSPQVVQTFPIDSGLAVTGGDAFILKPFDFIFVRSVAKLDSQMVVTLEGEVLYPGEYAIADKNEKLVDLIIRAGGLTQWADPNEATLVRPDDNRGMVFMDLEKALKDPSSRYNVLIRPGDQINVPVTNDIVTISGMINYPYKDSLGFLNAPYKSGKRAKWYVKKYGLGFDKDAKRVHTYVVQPGGVVEDPNRITFIRIYPKVQKGAYVVVPYTEPKLISAEAAAATGATAAKPVDWNQVIESAMIKITGLLTLYVLVTRINF
ncbi:MAG: SLBB domain-containing protein [Chitinophagales bacterium]|nr:SLBB domain-containing protein [Chitinophagales bacterium]